MIKKLIMFLITAGLVLQNINITAQAEETVSAELDSQTATQQNISVTMGTSSDVITKTQAGKTGWVLDTSDEVTDHAYIYADVSDTVLNKIKDYSNIYVTVEYYDSGYGWFKIIYDSLSSILTHSEYVFCENTGQWKKYTFRLQDAYFNNRINSKYDFYITGYDPTNYKFSGTELIVSKIDVSVDNMKSPAKVNAKTDNIGNIFFDGDEKKFSVDFVNRSASEILAELSYTVYDYDENVADYGYKAVNLEASGSGTYYITPNVDKYGVYTLKLELKNDTVYTVKEYDFSVCPKNNELNKNVGICNHGDANIIPLAKNVGIGHIRDEINWATVEKKSVGNFIMPETKEDYINKIVEAGIEPLLLLNYGNPLYPGCETINGLFDDEETLNAYANYVAYMVTYYKGRINNFEIWNEPELRGDKGEEHAKKYLAMMEAAYSAGKKANPKATFAGFGGTSGMFLTSTKRWFKYVLDNMETKCYDVIALHPYSVNKTPEARQIVDLIEEYRQMCINSGFEPEAIWGTEMGWSTDVSGSDTQATEIGQAAMSVRQLALTATNNIENRMFLYDFIDDGLRKNYKENNFGIVRNKNYSVPYAAKPSFIAISNYNRLTANAYEAEDLSSGSNYVVHTLAPHGEAYIMWTTNTESVLSMDFSDNAVFMDMYGNSIKNEAETLTLTPQPVYAYIENPEYIKNYSDGNADVVLNIKENSKKAVVIKSEEDAMSDSFFDNILYFNQYEADENNNVVSSFNVKKSINPYVGYVSGENTYKTFKFSAFSKDMEELALYKDNEMITAADKESLKSAVTAAVRIPAEYLGTEYKFIYAFYNNGVLVDVASRTGAGENELNFAALEFTVATESEFDEVRLFLWDSYNGVKPIKDSKEILIECEDL